MSKAAWKAHQFDRARRQLEADLRDVEVTSDGTAIVSGSTELQARERARTFDNAIARWVNDVRRDLRDARGEACTITTNRVPDPYRATLMRAMAPDGLVCLQDRGTRTEFTFRAVDAHADNEPEPTPREVAARRLEAALREEDAARYASRHYALRLRDHRRAVVRSSIRRVVCDLIVCATVALVVWLVGAPDVAIIATALALTAVADYTGGRPMVRSRVGRNPHPGDWSTVCETYEAALLELYAAEVADGVARMLEARGGEQLQLEAGS